MGREIRGIHVFAVFAGAFAVIIAVNMTLAVQAVRTFPGLEVKNTYVASQTFDADRAAQRALGWDVTATLVDGTLRLAFADHGGPVEPTIEKAILGRATTIAEDRTPDFVFDGTAFRAQVDLDPGNWNLRLRAIAEDGTVFQRRFVIVVRP